MRSRIDSGDSREATACVAEFVNDIDQTVTANQHAVVAEIDHAAQRIDEALRTVET